MEFQPLLIEALKGALVGGLIGYLTNRLAVWMLFHPKKKRRLFGLHVPLTPGLIVKNQERLADAIGRAVSRDLLDSETLVAHFGGLDLATPIRSLLNDERRELAKSPETLAGLLGPEHRESLLMVRDTVRDDLLRRADEFAGKLERREPGAEEILRAMMGRAFDAPIGDYLGLDQRRALRKWMIAHARDYVMGEQGAGAIERALDEALERIPGSSTLNALSGLARQAVQPHLARISHALQRGLSDYFATEEFLELAHEPLASYLYKTIVDRYAMAAMFISEDKVSDMLYRRWDGVVAKLQELVRREELTVQISHRLDLRVGDFVQSFGDSLVEKEQRGRFARWLTDEARGALLSFLDGDTAATAVDRILDSLAGQSASTLLSARGEAADALARRMLARLTDWMQSSEGRGLMRARVESFLDRLIFEKPVGEMVRYFPETEWEAVGDVLGRVFQGRAMRLLPVILSEHVDLAGVVSDKIRDFDTNQLEEIIVRVSGRELRGIVRLGGLIGLVVGAIMQVIYALT